VTEVLAILGFALVCIASYWVQHWVESESGDDCSGDAEACGHCATPCEQRSSPGRTAT